MCEDIVWESDQQLVPAIIQDQNTRQVLMLGYMNEASFKLTKESGQVHFFSRSKNRIWRKGESSGHLLKVENVALDCDRDAILVQVTPNGPTCHTGQISCFGRDREPILVKLESLANKRLVSPEDGSYTSTLFQTGIKRLAQKVGEEGVEVALAATAGDKSELVSEAADLVFHLLLLLVKSGVKWSEVLDELEQRNLLNN